MQAGLIYVILKNNDGPVRLLKQVKQPDDRKPSGWTIYQVRQGVYGGKENICGKKR